MVEEKKRIPVMTFTEFDQKVADAVVRTGSVKHAALDLGVNVRVIYNRAYQIRKQSRRAMLFRNRIIRQRQRSAKLDKLWRPILTVHEEKEEEEGEEEES